jgi:creatinine amidohydrolase
MRGAFLQDLTWPEAADWFARGAVVVLPIGALAKQHGRHLPLATDYLLAERLVRGLAERLPVLVAPIVGFGYYPAFTAYAGSQHLRAETFVALLSELMAGLIRQGATRLALLNTGVSTEAPVRLALRQVFEETGVLARAVDLGQLALATKRQVAAMPQGGHADEAETSLLLAIAPERVRLERAVSETLDGSADAPSPFYHTGLLTPVPGAPGRFSASGATGDPRLATAAKGAAILAAMLDELEAGLRTEFPEVLAGEA